MYGSVYGQMYGLIDGSMYGQMYGLRTDMRTALELEHAPLLSRGRRGNQDGEAVGRWHTAAVAYCRLQAPAADQCLKKISSHGHRSQARGLTPAGNPDPLY
jgi:hypothetical protein